MENLTPLLPPAKGATPLKVGKKTSTPPLLKKKKLQDVGDAPGGGAAPRKIGVASSRAKIFEDPNCVDARL